MARCRPICSIGCGVSKRLAPAVRPPPNPWEPQAPVSRHRLLARSLAVANPPGHRVHLSAAPTTSPFMPPSRICSTSKPMSRTMGPQWLRTVNGSSRGSRCNPSPPSASARRAVEVRRPLSRDTGGIKGTAALFRLGLDGTLTVCVPRRQLVLHWWLPAAGDPASLAGRLAPLQGPADVRPRRRRARSASLPGAADPGVGHPGEAFGDGLLRCLLTATPLSVQPSLDEGKSGAQLGSFHTEITVHRWHRGPLWLAIWRCHRQLGWQRRCGPMPLADFLLHQTSLQRQSARQSGAPVRRPFSHGP